MKTYATAAAARKAHAKRMQRRRVACLIISTSLAFSVPATYGSIKNHALQKELQQSNETISYLADQNLLLIEQNKALSVSLATKTDDPVPIYSLPLDEDLQRYTYEMCEKYDIVDNYELVLAIMWQESNFTEDAISSTSDYGIMQINKCNHAWLSETLGISDFLDARQSIEAGTYMISTMLHKYTNNHKALMAYNMGERGAAAQWAKGIYSSTYSNSVMAKLDLIKQDNYQ